MSGNIGRDLVFGGLNDDLLYGGDDSDRLYGNRGLDDLNGGSGNDDLYGGRDADQLVGDAGNDDYSDSSDQILDDSSDSSSNGDFEIRGTISGFNSANQTFQVLGITVNYSSAEFVANVNNGSFVKVDGQYNGNQINAREVEIELDDDRDENIQITGAISNLDTNNQTFQLLGFTVRFDNARVETSLFNGNSVEVEGFFANGLIDAEEIS